MLSAQKNYRYEVKYMSFVFNIKLRLMNHTAVERNREGDFFSDHLRKKHESERQGYVRERRVMMCHSLVVGGPNTLLVSWERSIL